MIHTPKLLSPGEECFALHCRAHLLTPEREYVFALHRSWKLDFAWPDLKIAVEVEGGTRQDGRHNRHEGFSKDCEKYNYATKTGWKIFRYTTEMVFKGTAINDILEMLP